MENMVRKRNVMAAFIIKEIIDGDEEEEFVLTKYAKVRESMSDVFSNRRSEGMFSSLVKNHLLDDEEKFRRYLRLPRGRFFDILNLINDDLTTSSYNRVKEPITTAEKLAVTLRFMATGESNRSLAFGPHPSLCYM
ncbi:uncharacterized protein LOC120350371 [Nilaparvata lugens]|uniref:uncharacterized protein LOC120350371 n=1 Tax=Nilaparvata lugens TaxID=108931 RepID=UPI00193EA810|nr:uncharacterized protein LOC120350371 [Nilaparvata lugens]